MDAIEFLLSKVLRESGEKYFEWANARLEAFSEALYTWLYELLKHPHARWQDELDALLAEQASAGREITPESRQALIERIELRFAKSTRPRAQDSEITSQELSSDGQEMAIAPDQSTISLLDMPTFEEQFLERATGMPALDSASVEAINRAVDRHRALQAALERQAVKDRESIRQLGRDVADIVGGIFIPGVGEAQDAAVVADPNAPGWQKTLATISLAYSAWTGGEGPNAGSFFRAADQGGDAARAASRKAIHGNSLDYVGDTHIYVIKGPEGPYKVGESMQGVRKSDSASIRGETQARALRKETAEPYESEIRKTFPDKRSAREYEKRYIETYRRLFGDDALPGNKTNR